MTDKTKTEILQSNTFTFGEESRTVTNARMNLKFPGQYKADETGYSQNYFRDYDASLGRYIQSDPIGLSGGVNSFAYVGGNPVGAVDLEGLHHEGNDRALPSRSTSLIVIKWRKGVYNSVSTAQGINSLSGNIADAATIVAVIPGPHQPFTASVAAGATLVNLASSIAIDDTLGVSVTGVKEGAEMVANRALNRTPGIKHYSHARSFTRGLINLPALSFNQARRMIGYVDDKKNSQCNNSN
ncbi:MAG: hypothetical protein OFPI_27200 [Osedax symbiont Rs2]|nr:MAG: hypothetical protein OFPI_27200 [Osedax symbiont Rs2]